jgi:hypothetical protein
MGYRSEVGYKIKFDKQEDFWGFIAEAKLDPDTVLCGVKNTLRLMRRSMRFAS